jgi:hypothetical protein
MVSTARADLASPVARDRASPAPAPPFARAYFLLASHRVTVVVRVESRAPAPRSFAAHRRNAHRAPCARCDRRRGVGIAISIYVRVNALWM